MRLEAVKLPDARNSNLYSNRNLKECERECLKSCNCTGYAILDVTGSEQGCITCRVLLLLVEEASEEESGYMSLKYTLDGVFSMKSDIFSFGVILLEIISGKKNRGFFHDDPYSNLIQYTWELWRDGKALEIVDSCITDSYSSNELLRCIQVGHLCAQDNARDRPSMSTVVFMLCNETILPSPKKSTFATGKNEPNSSTTGHKVFH
ncbi:hypothetical protein EZV62_026510 [Acer yangbiense]|uniref:Apple domain-containing protein n=1 Tax=Acer yangbiense TaxID=1000413 RepID=A0A5C7GSW4_9ROSI|nr:hypothetical protein EZV62_026510 [Acer yangbiense]